VKNLMNKMDQLLKVIESKWTMIGIIKFHQRIKKWKE